MSRAFSRLGACQENTAVGSALAQWGFDTERQVHDPPPPPPTSLVPSQTAVPAQKAEKHL